MVIRITGLRKVRLAAWKLDHNAPRALKDAATSSSNLLASKTRRRMPTGPGEGGHVKGSVKVVTSQTTAGVTFGGRRFPYAPWLEFGGNVGKGGSVHRPYLSSGRYLWVAYVTSKSSVENDLTHELASLARRSGFRVGR